MRIGGLQAGTLLVAVLAGAGTQAAVASGPVCPATGRPPVPDYAEIGKPPAAATWRDLDFGAGGACSGAFGGRAKLAVALAARFRGPAAIDDIAARIGAISATAGLVYWSTTDGNWRPLISEAAALRGASADSVRPDFAAGELLAGRTLYFRQNDTRSTGWNVYSLRARREGPDRLVIEIVNLTPIRFLLVTLAPPRSLVSVHVIARLGPGLWGYYGLSAVRGDAAEGFERSLINRAAAFYRFLTGRPGDAGPPLAP